MRKIHAMNDFDQQHIWHPYAKIPNEISTHLVSSAAGVYLNLENGKRVIDGMSAWWSAIHGYNHPILNQALTEQIQQMSHVMFGGLTHKPAIDLAKTLINITPAHLDKVFFSDSGSVAVEVALKMALQYWQNKNQPNKCRFVTLQNGYHGDTFGAMSVCDPDNGMHHLFTNVLAQNIFIKSPAVVSLKTALADLEQTLRQNSQNIAAMILEPVVQGAGGMRFYDAHYLTRAQALCQQYEVLFIVDEIATGFGRTGKLFASEYAQIAPDILCLGKALTGGYMSLAATLTSAQVADGVGTLIHGPTFMANPLACALANANIALLLDTPWQTNVAHIEKEFKQQLTQLRNHKKVADVRILGAIAVVEMVDEIDVETVQNRLLDLGVWLRPFGKLLYTLPPFNISDDELLTLTNAIKTVVQ